MKILRTDDAGFIGSNLSDTLLKRSNDVVGIGQTHEGPKHLIEDTIA